MPAQSTTNIPMQSASGLRFDVGGSAPTMADSQAEAEAKLALTAGTLLAGARRSEVFVPTAAPAAGAAADAILYLQKGSDRQTRRGIKINNMAVSFKDTDLNDGTIKLPNAAITAFASAYRDGTGTGGYTCVGGKFLD